MLLRADLHVHTNASPDSLLTPERLLQACLQRGLDAVAVTDHNCLTGALEVAHLAPPNLRVIIGEEVCSAQGELLGLFLREEVAPGQDARETARAIRAQGGLVGIPHPGDLWRHVLDRRVLEALWVGGLLDFIEGRNGRVLRRRDNRRAEELGHRLGLPLAAGSDAHSAGEVGACVTILPAFDGPQGFLAALTKARMAGRPSPPWAHLSSMWARLGQLLR